jgi:hypothetical protein
VTITRRPPHERGTSVGVAGMLSVHIACRHGLGCPHHRCCASSPLARPRGKEAASRSTTRFNVPADVRSSAACRHHGAVVAPPRRPSPAPLATSPRRRPWRLLHELRAVLVLRCQGACIGLERMSCSYRGNKVASGSVSCLRVLAYTSRWSVRMIRFPQSTTR